MRALCLLGVLVLAKVMVLASHGAGWSGWAAVAYFSPDVVVAAGVALIDRLLRQPRAGWIVYGTVTAYVALNVPIAVVLGSPMTMPMIRATGGPLADSIAYYLTAANIARVLAVTIVGSVLPFVLTYVGRAFRPGMPGGPEGPPYVLTAALSAVLLLGPLAATRVDTRGLERNAFTALIPVSLPAVNAAGGSRELRSSPYPAPIVGPDLTRLRGSAHGMNVIVVILESTGAQYLKPYGAPDDPMPNLTKLTGRAVLFEHAYAVYPESIKGLLASLCSRYPSFGEPAENQALEPCDSIAQELAHAGYRTGLFHSGRFGYLGMDAVVERLGFDTLEDAGAIGGNVRSSFGVDETAAVDRMLAWIDSRPTRDPFFLSYLPVAGHHPYASATPGPFQGDTDFDRYRNALHDGDAALGRLLDGLRERRLDDRTVVIVFGDHGEAFGQHAGNIGHTMFIDDENVRVPYVIAIPGVTAGATRVPGAASLLDTAPTILDVLGLPPAARHQGTSLLQRDARMALFFTDYSLGWLGLRDGCWTYHLEVASRRAHLFEVCRDATETHDLAANDRDRAQVYEERLREWSGRDLR